MHVKEKQRDPIITLSWNNDAKDVWIRIDNIRALPSQMKWRRSEKKGKATHNNPRHKQEVQIPQR